MFRETSPNNFSFDRSVRRDSQSANAGAKETGQEGTDRHAIHSATTSNFLDA